MIAEEEEDIVPSSLPTSRRTTRKIAPYAPRACRKAFSPATASVSPVGSKKNVEKFEPGNQAIFSGRLNGVAPAAFAAALASKLVVSPALAV